MTLTKLFEESVLRLSSIEFQEKPLEQRLKDVDTFLKELHKCQPINATGRMVAINSARKTMQEAIAAVNPGDTNE